jgi:alpha-L-fucosidase
MLQLVAASVPAVYLADVLGQTADADAAAAAAAVGTAPASNPPPSAAVVLPPAPAPIPAPPGLGVAAGPFQPSWESLSSYQVPDWYRDAKFGIWAHWGPQCQPEMGDWYAQRMYQPNNAAYTFHVQKYGHPSKFGFKDVINEWKAEKWEPQKLIALYKKAGAKFFAAMANHHDNLDMFDSTYQPWNSTRVGPKKDIVGGWMKATREAGLRFAISSHGDRAWDWMQVAQGADASGEFAGVRYDGLLSKADGKGKWWEGLDPQDLYAQYHSRGSYGWNLSPRGGGRGGGPGGTTPPLDPNYIAKFFNRTIDLINKYQPDLLYFDDTVLPIYPSGDIGLRIAAYLYNTNLARHGGKLEAVMTGKGLNARQRRALVYDVERGVTSGGETLPWQTDTCIGSWHYQRSVFEQHKYKTSKQVVQMLIDIVSKNGNLMLSVPLRGDGTLDEDEVGIVDGIGVWMAANGEGIYGTRPWKVYGEGPSVVEKAEAGRFGGARDVRSKSYTAEDVRFTMKGDTGYAFVMAWPENGKVTLKSLAQGGAHYPNEIARVELLGHSGPLTFNRDTAGLVVNFPDQKSNQYAYALKITRKS